MVQVHSRVPALHVTWAAFPLCLLAPWSWARRRLWGSVPLSARCLPHPSRGAAEGQTRQGSQPWAHSSGAGNCF